MKTGRNNGETMELLRHCHHFAFIVLLFVLAGTEAKDTGDGDIAPPDGDIAPPASASETTTTKPGSDEEKSNFMLIVIIVVVAVTVMVLVLSITGIVLYCRRGEAVDEVFEDMTDDLALSRQAEDDKWKIANNTGVPPSLQENESARHLLSAHDQHQGHLGDV